MRIRGPKGLWLGIGIGCCVTSVMLGAPTANFGITGAGPNGYNLAGVYTDPYAGCVGCTSASNPGTAMQIFCDDFTDDVTPPEYWTAFANGLSSFTGGSDVSTVYYSSSVTSANKFSALPKNLLTTTNNTTWSSLVTAGFSQTTDYIAAVILAAQSITSGNTLTGAARETAQNDLSFALWGIFDPTLLDTTTTAGKYGTMDTTDLHAAQIDLENALITASTYTSGDDFTQKTGINATIYSAVCAPTSQGITPIGCTPGQLWNPSSTGRPQEFITVSMPEPSSLAALSLDFGGLGIAGLVFLRRRSRTFHKS